MEQNNMSNLNKDVLKELLVGDNSNKVFYEYKKPFEVGQKILDELYLRFSFNKGFRMDDNSKDVGLLSQCQSLQSLLLLTSEFSLEFDEEDYFKDNRTFSDGTKPTIRRIMDSVIEDIIRRVVRYNGEPLKNVNILENDKLPEDFYEKSEFCFDASPYDSDSFSSDYSYIDSITWVIPTFLLVLKYHATKLNREDCKWEKCLVAIIKHGLKYLNDSFIIDEQKEERLENAKNLEIGWNFTKQCEEPSLYFTFAVCECYVDFYETFKNHLDYEEAVFKKKKYGLPISKELKQAQKKHEKSGAEVKLKELFTEINGGDAFIYSIDEKDEDIVTPYGLLEKNCKLTANKIWSLSKNDLADKFFYNDLGSTLDENAIKMSTTSDALFNSVYIVNTIIDAGVDEDIKSKIELALDRGLIGEANKYQEEYDDLFEVCQLAIQRAMRTYEKLKKESKEYIVDQFLVGFNETFKVHNDRIKDLRKRRMRVFSLAPLLIHSNNVIGQYLIRYPQYNMKKYLRYILENRLAETDSKTRVTKSKWIWEADGFFSASNYYYIAALGEFYDYYNTYEKAYIDISQNREEAAEEIRDEYKRELETTGAIADMRNELEEKNEQILKLKAEKEAIETPVEDAVKKIIEQTVKEQLPGMLCEVLSKENQALKEKSALDRQDKERKMTDIAKAFDELLLEMFAFDGAVDGKRLREDTKDDARTLIKKEIARCREKFAVAVMFSDDNQSGLFED